MGSDEELSFGQRMGKKWRGFKQFLWNGDTKEFLGRGGISWAKISLFYLVFYTLLAAFWACMLLVFMQTIDYNRPKWVAYVSTPGLAITPSLNEERISFTPNNEATYAKHIKALTEIWDNLDLANQTHAEVCDPITETGNNTEQRICKFDRDQLGQFCTPEQKFGYNTLSPCILVNMNRVWGWTPEDPADDAENVPETHTPGYVSISCRPYKDKDAPGVNATTIYPPQGLPFAYFPYITGTSKVKQRLYIAPYVAVRVTLNEEYAQGRDVKVLCEAYTGNIDPRGGLFDFKDRSQFTVLFNLGKTAAAKNEM